MGWYSPNLGSMGGFSRSQPRNPSSFLSPKSFSITPSGRPPTPQKSLIERVEVNDAFDQMSNSAVGLFGTLGQLPSRIFETPVSLVDTAMQRATGFSPAAAVGNSPVGGAFRGIGEGIMHVGNFAASRINSHDARIWSAIADLPDSTPITDSLVEQRLNIGGLEGFVRDFGENTGGVPILGGIFGIGTRPKTVGEFRAELAKRGFFNDENGPLDPRQTGRDIRMGRRSDTDFGMAAINDNALVDFAGRMVTDPTNAIFFVPGGALVKAGATAARAMSLPKMARLGIASEKVAPPAIQAGEAMLRGERTAKTLKGIGTVLRGYRNLSIGTAAANFGINRLTSAANDLSDEPIPFLREIEEFTAAVENRQPMSNNAAFMLFSAATFPYNSTIIRPIRTATGKLREVTIGVDDMAPFSQAYGGRSNFLTAVGGPDSFRDLHGMLLAQLARQRSAVVPAELASISSTPSLALRRKLEQQAFERTGARMWANKEITADDLFMEFRKWAEEQGGVVSKDAHGNIIDQGVRMEFDPERAARTWREFRDGPRSIIKSALDETGEIIWGERDDVIFVEQIHLARTTARTAAYKDKSGERRVPRAVLLDFLEDNPNLNSLDKYGFWRKVIADEATDPLLKDVENKLNGQRRGAISTDAYFAEAAEWERSAPPDPAVPRMETKAQRIDRLRAELDETEAPARRDVVQRDLDEAIAAAEDMRWARDQSIDPDARRAIADELAETDSLLAPALVYPGLRNTDPATISRVVALEQELRDAGLHNKYRVKSLGREQNLATIPDSPLDVAIRQHTAVGEWLFERSPFSPIGKMLHTLTRSVGRDELARGQRIALGNAMVGKGFTPGQVNAIRAALQERVAEQGRLLTAKLYRGPDALLPSEINAIARRAVTENMPPAAAAKAVRLLDELPDGFYGVLSRASSRYWRSLHAKARSGDKGAQKLENIYNAWNDAPVMRGLSKSQRVVAKTVYPIFRFAMDIRWQFLNVVEGGILSTAKDGYIKAYTNAAQASPAAQRALQQTPGSHLGTLMPDAGLTLTNENLHLIAMKSFDKRSAKSIVNVLDELGESDPALVATRRQMLREATDLDAAAAAADDAAMAATLRARAERLREQGSGSMAEHLNDTLYRFEQDGPKKATLDEFERFLDADEIAAMRPLIDRVAEINRQHWDDVQQMLHGNPRRSTLERIANSYWFYWPLSYQIKATKWLADTMLNGSFGHNNGALLAGRYALWMEQHRDRMERSPEYAAMYQANSNLWFAVQMILPMAPEDIGISLGKAASLAGAVGQNFANEWFGTDIGIFTTSTDRVKDVAWLTKMGPIYTAEFIQRITSEADKEGFFAPDLTPSAAR